MDRSSFLKFRDPHMRSDRRIIAWVRVFSATVLPALFAPHLSGQTLVMSDGAFWNTCSGTFYDSGGPGNDYNNNEDMTATICPSGGGGSGLATSVHFLSFEAEHNDDQLVIHNGESTAAPILATGNENSSLAGQTFTASAPSGCLTFQWISDNPANAAGWVAEVITGADAGNDATLSVCNDQPAFPLLDILGGDPDNGGSWTGPGGAHGPQYDPATEPSGIYTYTVMGESACADVATVTLTNVPAPNAGENGSLLICGLSPPTNLINSVGGSPSSGGSWTGPNGAHDGSYDPGSDPSGTYTYTVSGTAPCPNASSTVTVVINGPNAGVSAAITVCTGQSPFPLLDALGGSPDGGGAWTGPGGAHGAQYDPGSDPGGVYTYTVTDGSCVASSTLTITNATGPDAGEDGTLSICAMSPPVNLFNSLGGTPGSGGSWIGPGGPCDNSYDPASDQPGDYTYSVAGIPPCPNASATVTVVISGPDAGISTSLTLCSGQSPFFLFDALDGSPDVGGAWTGPAGPHGPQYDPGSDPSGAYTYSVMDGSLCTSTATVTITNMPGPDAGEDGTFQICELSPPTDLFGSLAGTPEPGGTWNGPGGPHDGSYDPTTDPPGPYVYTVNGSAPCPYASATVTVILSGLPDAGSDGAVLVCDTATALDLFTSLGATPDEGGTWQDIDGSGGLSNGILNTTGLSAGVYAFLYTVAVIGCATDEALVNVQVLESVAVTDLSRRCDEVDGTSIITFTVEGGDAATYAVAGVPGALGPTEPFVFTSEPLPDSLEYTIVVTDQNGCGSVQLVLLPCAYETQVFIPESFSPNGDGINDTFLIPGLDAFPNNELHIFNRWGSQLYYARKYHQTRGWDGGGGTGNVYLQGDLPTGTYYYLLDLGNGAEAYRGFIYLNR
jgi:gliding motility-associated-like protein